MTEPDASAEEDLRRKQVVALNRGAQGCVYADDARLLHELATDLASGGRAGDPAELAESRRERDEARSERDRAHERADTAEKQLADARDEIATLRAAAAAKPS